MTSLRWSLQGRPRTALLFIKRTVSPRNSIAAISPIWNLTQKAARDEYRYCVTRLYPLLRKTASTATIVRFREHLPRMRMRAS